MATALSHEIVILLWFRMLINLNFTGVGRDDRDEKNTNLYSYNRTRALQFKKYSSKEDSDQIEIDEKTW